ncbi:hypothetical protein ASD81_00765 [Nocardioides sp. Root614]|nr:hypothetical protein ASD81_00765 [Nocardioides sp. Root614]
MTFTGPTEGSTCAAGLARSAIAATRRSLRVASGIASFISSDSATAFTAASIPAMVRASPWIV